MDRLKIPPIGPLRVLLFKNPKSATSRPSPAKAPRETPFQPENRNSNHEKHGISRKREGLWDFPANSLISSDPPHTLPLRPPTILPPLLITLDKDFGELAIVKGLPPSGIVRLAGFRTAQMAIAIHYVVTRYQHELLAGAIITVDPERIRIRAS